MFRDTTEVTLYRRGPGPGPGQVQVQDQDLDRSRTRTWTWTWTWTGPGPGPGQVQDQDLDRSRTRTWTGPEPGPEPVLTKYTFQTHIAMTIITGNVIQIKGKFTNRHSLKTLTYLTNSNMYEKVILINIYKKYKKTDNRNKQNKTNLIEP